MTNDADGGAENSASWFIMYSSAEYVRSSFTNEFFADVVGAAGAGGPGWPVSGLLVGPDEAASPLAVAPPTSLLSCDALVPLYSDEFFRDARCLRDWTLFRERVRQHSAVTGRPSGALVGVRWATATVAAPPAVVDSGILAGPFGDDYTRFGALRLMRTAPGSDEYHRLVARVAEAVVAATRDRPRVWTARDVLYSGDPSGGGPHTGDGATGSRAAGETPPATPAGPASGRLADAAATVVVALASGAPTAALAGAAITRALRGCGLPDPVHTLAGDGLVAELETAMREDRTILLLLDAALAVSDEYAERLALVARWGRRDPSAIRGLVLAPSDPDSRPAAGALRERLAAFLRENREWARMKSWRTDARGAERVADYVVGQAIRLTNGRRDRPAKTTGHSAGEPAPEGERTRHNRPSLGRRALRMEPG